MRYESYGASNDGSATHARHCRATTKCTFTESTLIRENWFDGTDEQVKLITQVQTNERTYMKNILKCTYVLGTSSEQGKLITKVEMNGRTYMKNMLKYTCVLGTSS